MQGLQRPILDPTSLDIKTRGHEGPPADSTLTLGIHAWQLQVQMEFGMSKMSHAIRLHQRASDMANHGFEWALQHGEPRNPWALQYPLTPPCCKLKVHMAGAQCLSDQPFTPCADQPSASTE